MTSQFITWVLIIMPYSSLFMLQTCWLRVNGFVSVTLTQLLHVLHLLPVKANQCYCGLLSHVISQYYGLVILEDHLPATG